MNTMYDHSLLSDYISAKDFNRMVEKDLFEYIKLKPSIKREGVDELILTDQHVPASAGLEPAVAITAQQDRRPRGMIENIILYDRLPRRAEQGTAGTVIPDHVIRE